MKPTPPLPRLYGVELSDKNFEELKKAVLKNGWSYSGTGGYSWVATKENVALKLMSTYDDAYLEYIKFCTTQKNECFPKVQKKIVIGDEICVVYLERLEKAKGLNRRRIEKLHKLSRKGLDKTKDTTQEVQALKDITLFAQERQYVVDVCYSNVMIRPITQEFVYSDPVC